MFKLIYTKSLDKAKDLDADSWEYQSKDEAKKHFVDKLYVLMQSVLANELLESRLSIYKHKAVLKIEGTTYCLAIVPSGSIEE